MPLTAPRFLVNVDNEDDIEECRKIIITHEDKFARSKFDFSPCSFYLRTLRRPDQTGIFWLCVHMYPKSKSKYQVFDFSPLVPGTYCMYEVLLVLAIT